MSDTKKKKRREEEKKKPSYDLITNRPAERPLGSFSALSRLFLGSTLREDSGAPRAHYVIPAEGLALGRRSLEVTMGSAVERTDEHVREYLIYRGFTSTLKHLDTDIKADKEKGFRLFALQTESRDQRDGDETLHHKLPLYVQNMDRLGDTEL
ncbi:WD repeat-containing protein 91 [Liparis tanakae]|uniref:WD repeat-containing protein 91 n=1 Tax=Liparis tanakae TaxID=230148 RepID=A0A4Z2FAX7_9TELE|nr:WD repeat-containing protein 91 [Liparis tanakae]